MKALYEAENEDAKKGVAGGKAKPKLSNNITTADSAVVESFVANTAAKTNHSERVIQEEVQVATAVIRFKGKVTQRRNPPLRHHS